MEGVRIVILKILHHSPSPVLVSSVAPIPPTDIPYKGCINPQYRPLLIPHWYNTNKEVFT